MQVEFLSESYAKYNDKLNILLQYLPNLKEYNLDLDFVIFNDLADYLIELFNIFSKDKISRNSIENLMQKLHAQLEKCLKNYDKTENLTIVQKFENYKKISIFSNIMQCVLDKSFVIDYVLRNLQETLGQDYLKILQLIDKSAPSELTNFESEQQNSICLNNEFVSIYLDLKRWKDKLHLEFYSTIEPIAKSAKKQFFDYVIAQYPYLGGINKSQLYSAYILNTLGVVGIENLAKFVSINYYKFLASVFGGKNLGLAILYNVRADIPKTIALSVNFVENKNYTKLNAFLFPNRHYAVRSSATAEDNENQSYAGMFTSVIDVEAKNLSEAIDTVFQSINSSRVQEYTKHFNLAQPKMAVVVQEFSEPMYSGVFIGSKILSGRLEYVIGTGEKLVSGRATPNVEIWQDGICENAKLKFGQNFVGKQCINLQKIMNIPLDLEFCVVGDKLLFVQCRPVTQKVTLAQNTPQNNKNSQILGLSVSAGKFVGEPKFVSNFDEKVDFTDDTILLVEYTDPEWVPLILKSKAIVSAEGGMLSHTAIIARELSIPCVTSIGYQNLEKLSKCKKIEVNADTGEITIIDRGE